MAGFLHSGPGFATSIQYIFPVVSMISLLLNVYVCEQCKGYSLIVVSRV